MNKIRCAHRILGALLLTGFWIMTLIAIATDVESLGGIDVIVMGALAVVGFVASAVRYAWLRLVAGTLLLLVVQVGVAMFGSAARTLPTQNLVVHEYREGARALYQKIRPIRSHLLVAATLLFTIQVSAECLRSRSNGTSNSASV